MSFFEAFIKILYIPLQNYILLILQPLHIQTIDSLTDIKSVNHTHNLDFLALIAKIQLNLDVCLAKCSPLTTSFIAVNNYPQLNLLLS